MKYGLGQMDMNGNYHKILRNMKIFCFLVFITMIFCIGFSLSRIVDAYYHGNIDPFNVVVATVGSILISSSLYIDRSIRIFSKTRSGKF